MPTKPLNGNFLRRVPDSLLEPIVSGFLILTAGLLGIAFHRPWLFSSLGPTAFQTTEYPELKSSRIYNVFAGHFIAIGMGFAALAIMGGWAAPGVTSSHHLTLMRVWTAVIAIALTLMGTMVVRASHPPAAATTMLVALGSYQTAHAALTLIIGIVIIGVLGEGIRLMRLAHRARMENHQRAEDAS
jgi:hypothetical protein